MSIFGFLFPTFKADHAEASHPNKLKAVECFNLDAVKEMFTCLTPKELGMCSWINRGCKIVIDAHFTVIFIHQFVFRVEKHCSAKLASFPIYAIPELARIDFPKAFKQTQSYLSRGLNSNTLPQMVSKALSPLIPSADSKEKILMMLDELITIARKCGYWNDNTMPLTKKYFTYLATTKTEAHFKEGEALLKKSKIQNYVVFVALCLIDTFPELALEKKELIKFYCRGQLDFRGYGRPEYLLNTLFGQFPFSTCFTLARITESIPSNNELVDFLARQDPSKEEVLALFASVEGALPWWLVWKFMRPFNLYELLRMAESMLGTKETYVLYHNIISSKVTSAEEFVFALQKLLERKSLLDPHSHLYQAFKSIVISTVAQIATQKYLSAEVYALLEHSFPNDPLRETYLHFARACAPLRLPLLEKMRKDAPSELCALMELEILTEQIEEAKRTFCSIKDPKSQIYAFGLLKYFVEKEEWHYFETFVKEFPSFYLDPSTPWYNPLNEQEYFPEFLNLLKQVAVKDLKRAVDLTKHYWQGTRLLRFLLELGVEQKNITPEFNALVADVHVLARQKHTCTSRDIALVFQFLEKEGDHGKAFGTAAAMIENGEWASLNCAMCVVRLGDWAHSREEIFKAFVLANLLQVHIDQHTFCDILYPLVRKYFALEPKTEASFNEALTLLSQFSSFKDLHFVMSLALVDAFPHFIKSHHIGQKFPVSTFLELYETQRNPSLLLEILNPKDDERATTHRSLVMEAATMGVHGITKCQTVQQRLDGIKLLDWALSLPDETATYTFYRKLFKEKLKTAEEFEIGLQHLLKRTPSHDLKQAVLAIVESAPLKYLTPTVVALLKSTFPGDPTFEKTCPNIAIEQEKDLSKAITLAKTDYTPEQQINFYIRRAQQQKTLGQDYRFLLAEARSLAFTLFAEKKPEQLINVLKQLLEVEKRAAQ